MNRRLSVRNPYTQRGLDAAHPAERCGKLDSFLTCPGAQNESDLINSEKIAVLV